MSFSVLTFGVGFVNGNMRMGVLDFRMGVRMRVCIDFVWTVEIFGEGILSLWV